MGLLQETAALELSESSALPGQVFSSQQRIPLLHTHKSALGELWPLLVRDIGRMQSTAECHQDSHGTAAMPGEQVAEGRFSCCLPLPNKELQQSCSSLDVHSEGAGVVTSHRGKSRWTHEKNGHQRTQPVGQALHRRC